MYVFVPNVNVTGSFPMGCIFVPFTVRGVMLEGSKLSSCGPEPFSQLPIGLLQSRVGFQFRGAIKGRDVDTNCRG